MISAIGDDEGENGYLSDDSSFYGQFLCRHHQTTIPLRQNPGDEHHRNSLENRAATFDPSTYWSTHSRQPSVIAATTIAQASKSLLTQKPYNPYEGSSSGRQLSETVASFLTRLPPLTTHVDNHGYWIYIANPRSKARPTDEDRAGLMIKGREILEDFEGTRAVIEVSMAGKAKSTIGRKLTPLRKQVEKDLYAVAKQHDVRLGNGCFSR